MSTFRAQKAHKTSKMDSPGPPLRSPRPPWLPPIRAFFTTGEFQPISLPSSPLCAISVPKKGPKRPEFSPPSYFFTHTTHPAPRSPRPLRLFLHPCPSAFICGSSSFALFASLREAILAALSAPSPRPLRLFLHPCPSALICGSSANHIAVRSTFSASSFALFASLREAILAALSAPSPRPLRLFLHPCPSALICGSSANHIAVRSTFSPSPSALFASLREAILAALSAPSPLSAVPLPSFPNQVGIFSCSNRPKIPTFRGVPPFFRNGSPSVLGGSHRTPLGALGVLAREQPSWQNGYLLCTSLAKTRSLPACASGIQGNDRDRSDALVWTTCCGQRREARPNSSPHPPRLVRVLLPLLCRSTLGGSHRTPLGALGVLAREQPSWQDGYPLCTPLAKTRRPKARPNSSPHPARSVRVPLPLLCRPTLGGSHRTPLGALGVLA